MSFARIKLYSTRANLLWAASIQFIEKLTGNLARDWAATPAASHRAVHSLKCRATPGRNPEGRSGNHRMEGFLIAAGKDIKSGTIKAARLIDLAPTILTLLEQPVPPEMEGRALFHPRHS